MRKWLKRHSKKLQGVIAFVFIIASVYRIVISFFRPSPLDNAFVVLAVIALAIWVPAFLSIMGIWDKVSNWWKSD